MYLAAKTGLPKVGEDEMWICDSGASVHMNPSAGAIYAFDPFLTKHVRVAPGELFPIEGHGSVNVVLRSNGKFT